MKKNLNVVKVPLKQLQHIPQVMREDDDDDDVQF